MGCSCSRDVDDAEASHRQRDRHSDVGVSRRHLDNGSTTRRGRSPDDQSTTSSVEARRRAQEETDHMIAQLVQFEEQLLHMERQQRIAQRRADREAQEAPVITGLSSREMESVGKVLLFDTLKKKKTYSTHMPGHVTGSTSLSFDQAAPHGGSTSLPASPISPAAPNFSFDPSDTHAECALCMEELIEGVELRSLFCGHIFHRECVDDWLRRKRVCPMCQQDVTVATTVAKTAQKQPLANTSVAADTPMIPPPTTAVATTQDADASDDAARELVVALAMSMGLVTEPLRTTEGDDDANTAAQESPLDGGDSPARGGMRDAVAGDSGSAMNREGTISMSNVVLALVVAEHPTTMLLSSSPPLEGAALDGSSSGSDTASGVVVGTIVAPQPMPEETDAAAQVRLSTAVATANPLNDAPASPSVEAEIAAEADGVSVLVAEQSAPALPAAESQAAPRTP